MKPVWVLAASLFSQLAVGQTPPDPAAIELMIAKEQYSKSLAELQRLPDYNTNPHWHALHAKVLIAKQDNEAAAEFVEQALKRFPQDAELHQVSATNQFALAQKASLFSAPGYAKDGLANLKEAVRLAPDNSQFVLNLIGFYLQAPGIVGGDDETGKQLAAEMPKQDPIAAILAQTMVLHSDDKADDALRLLDEQLRLHPEHPQLLAQKAQLIDAKKQPAAAFAAYQQAAAHADQPDEKYQQLYQVGRLAAVSAQDKTIGKQALNEVIAFYQDGEGQAIHWARLRLAQIHLLENNRSAAEQELAPVLALKTPSESLEKELKSLKKKLKKQSNS